MRTRDSLCLWAQAKAFRMNLAHTYSCMPCIPYIRYTHLPIHRHIVNHWWFICTSNRIFTFLSFVQAHTQYTHCMYVQRTSTNYNFSTYYAHSVPVQYPFSLQEFFTIRLYERRKIPHKFHYDHNSQHWCFDFSLKCGQSWSYKMHCISFWKYWNKLHAIFGSSNLIICIMMWTFFFFFFLFFFIWWVVVSTVQNERYLSYLMQL